MRAARSRAGRCSAPLALAVASMAALPTGVAGQMPAGDESRTLARAAQAAQAGRTEVARDILVDLLAVEPASPAALAALFQLLTPRGRAEEVIPLAERAVERSGPDRTTVMQIWIRALQAAGLSDSAVAAAGRWAGARPGERAPRSALAEALARAGEAEQAVETLRAGRLETADTTAFAQELSALLATLGRYDEAAAEWSTILAWGDPGVAAVADRIESPGTAREQATGALRERLAHPDASFAARRGGLSLAIRLDEPEWARELAGSLTGDAPEESRRLVFRDYYVAARNREWLAEAEWAADRLEREAATPPEQRHWAAMRAELAYLRGDTERAAPALAEIAAAAEPGTETHRRSLRRLFSIRVAAGRPEEAEALLAAYGGSYPDDVAERVEMSVELSRALVRAGAIDDAGRVLDVAGPPPSDAALVARIEAQRGVLALLRGRPALARSHLETAAFVPGGDAVRRTDALLLVDALARADSADAARLGAGMLALVIERSPASLVGAVSAWTAGSEMAGGPSLVAIAAGAFDREGFRAEGTLARERLVATWPEAPETPGALLELGRAAAETGRPDDAGRWLERLIVSFPGHALAPIARRELADLTAKGPGEAPGSIRP